MEMDWKLEYRKLLSTMFRIRKGPKSTYLSRIRHAFRVFKFAKVPQSDRARRVLEMITMKRMKAHSCPLYVDLNQREEAPWKREETLRKQELNWHRFRLIGVPRLQFPLAKIGKG